jgi:hypothetical protein
MGQTETITQNFVISYAYYGEVKESKVVALHGNLHNTKHQQGRDRTSLLERSLFSR